MKTVYSFENKKAPGYDGITNEILKYIVNDICEPLVYIINKSFATEIFPRAPKMSIVQPVFRTGDVLEVTNNRSIWLLPALSKVFGKILNERLVS